MKKTLILIISFFTIFLAQAQVGTEVELKVKTQTNGEAVNDLLDEEEEKGKVFSTVKSISIFPGCESEPDWKKKYICTDNAIYNHIQNETKFPKEAYDKKEEGIIYVNFIIDTLGSVTDVRLTKGLIWSPSLEAEAIRVIKSLPKMIPGTVQGSKVPVMYSQTIRFYLDEEKVKEREKRKLETAVVETKKEVRKRLRKEKKERRKSKKKE